MMLTKKHVPVEPPSQPVSLTNVILNEVTENGIEFNWKGLISIAIGLWTGWGILRKL